MAVEFATEVLHSTLSAVPFARQYKTPVPLCVEAPLQVTATAVEAGTPVQVYAVFVVEIAVEAMVQTPIEEMAVPAPSFKAPGITVEVTEELPMTTWLLAVACAL